MALRDLFRRRNQTDGQDPIGMGDSDGDYEDGEGGPSIYKQELAEYRWAAQQEALNVGRRGVDPERWDDGRMSFEFERALAHGHEGLRDRLATYVGQRVRDEVRDLYELASDVALARDSLRDVDDELLHVTRHWKQKHEEVTDNELDVDRYYRLKSVNGKVVKYLIAAVFVVGEFIISGLVFERLFEDLPPGLGYVLAFGVTLALIVIPHYAALGLKEGLTQYHVFEKRALEKAGVAVPLGVDRAVHFEEQDDRGFRWAAFAVGFGLLAMVVPLSVIRTHGEGEEFSWAAFFFLLLLQYALSGYFFLREWLDHGQPSHSLHMLDEQKAVLQAQRTAALEDHADAVTQFHDTAEDLIFTLQQAPRWDSHIVESYLETIRYFRHLITIEQPEYEQFITWARVPYLGSRETTSESEYPLDPVSNEHRSLEEPGPLGREWWLRTAGDALRQAPSDEGAIEAGGDDSLPGASWLITKSPNELLATFLSRYFDLPTDYQRPDGIDESEDEDGEARDEPPDASTAHAVDSAHGDEHDRSSADGSEDDVERGLRELLKVDTSDDSPSHAESETDSESRSE
jgi:hypothetical protein